MNAEIFDELHFRSTAHKAGEQIKSVVKKETKNQREYKGNDLIFGERRCKGADSCIDGCQKNQSDKRSPKLTGIHITDRLGQIAHGIEID